MPLAPGQSFGSYRIVEKIGEGGMGVVWKAVDTALGREVALKVLPADLAADPDRMARFEREARLLASLNHPNVATVHGLQEAEGIRFLAMELAAGEDLAERLQRGPLAPEDALAIAAQVAAGLEAAHEQGVVHRDLKPANVRVAPDGRVKVIDFGLAKSLGPERGATDPSLSPTLTAGGTADGLILGTAAYMSPEQARGKAVDRRTDIWAFGCVLYEMLAGKPAFGGETVTDILGAILHRRPDRGALPVLPPGIHRLLDRCLRTEPAQRLQHLGDARLEIAEALARDEGDTGGAAAGARPGARRAWTGHALAVGAALAAGILGTLWLGGQPAPAPPPAIRFTVTHPPEEATGITNPVTAADGSFVVYLADERTGNRLYLRRLDQDRPRAIPETEGASAPFLSPDGRWVGYLVGTKLRKVALAGGVPVEICDAGAGPGAAWAPDDRILFSPSWTSGLHAVSAEGGEPVPFTTVDREQGEIGHWFPTVTPDGGAVLFTVWTRGGSLNKARMAMADLHTGERTDLGEGAAPRLLANGYLVYHRAGIYEAAPFAAGRLSAPPRRVLEDVPWLSPVGTRQTYYAFAETGLLAYVAQEDYQGTVPASLFWLDRSGGVERLSLPSGSYEGLALSPDGARLLVTEFAGGERDIWLHDLESGTRERLTREANNFAAALHPDGERIAFLSTRRGAFSPYVQALRGGAPAELLFDITDDVEDLTWSPEGGRMVFTRYTGAGGGKDLWIVDLPGGEPRPVVESPHIEDAPAISPDGRWLAYTSDRSGRTEVYVQPLVGPGAAVQVSRGGGSLPRWSSAGEILFRSAEGVARASWRVEGGRFAADRPVPFAAAAPRDAYAGFEGNWAVSADGRRVLLARSDRVAAARLHIVTDGFAEVAAQ